MAEEPLKYGLDEILKLDNFKNNNRIYTDTKAAKEIMPELSNGSRVTAAEMVTVLQETAKDLKKLIDINAEDIDRLALKVSDLVTITNNLLASDTQQAANMAAMDIRITANAERISGVDGYDDGPILGVVGSLNDRVDSVQEVVTETAGQVATIVTQASNDDAITMLQQAVQVLEAKVDDLEQGE